MSDTSQPIDTAPRDGSRIVVADGDGNIALAFWHRHRDETGMWAYALPKGHNLIHQVDIEPTQWASSARPFLADA